MKKKSLGQIAYEATGDGGRANFGPWEKTPEIVRKVHHDIAAAVERAVLRRVLRGMLRGAGADLDKSARRLLRIAAASFGRDE